MVLPISAFPVVRPLPALDLGLHPATGSYRYPEEEVSDSDEAQEPVTELDQQNPRVLENESLHGVPVPENQQVTEERVKRCRQRIAEDRRDYLNQDANRVRRNFVQARPGAITPSAEERREFQESASAVRQRERIEHRAEEEREVGEALSHKKSANRTLRF